MIEIFEKDYCTVKKLYIQNNIKKFDTEGIHVSGGRGIHVSGGEGIKILSCKIKNIGYEEWTPSYEGAISSENANPLLVVGVAGENAVTDLTIDGNEIYNCLTGYSEALTVAGDVAGFTIRNNIVHDNSNIGIVTAGHYGWTTKDWNENSVYNNLSDDIRSKNIARNGTVSGNLVYNCVTRSTNENGEVISSAGIYIDGGKDITLERNVSRNNGVGFSIGCEECKMNDPDNDVTGIIMRNNLSYNNNGAGLVFGSNKSGNNGPYAPISNCKALNNTFYKNLRTQPSGAEITLQHNSTENLIKQNIIYVDYAGAKCYQAIGNWGFSSEASFDNNLYSDIPSNNGCPRFSEHLTIEINAKIGDIVLDSGLRPLIDSPVFDSNVSPDEDLV